jgi:predicted phosphodiesterase
MKMLAISDTRIDFIYSPLVKDRFSKVDIVISCGDLPYYYSHFEYPVPCSVGFIAFEVTYALEIS